jgi:hypothetical protein
VCSRAITTGQRNGLRASGVLAPLRGAGQTSPQMPATASPPCARRRPADASPATRRAGRLAAWQSLQERLQRQAELGPSSCRCPGAEVGAGQAGTSHPYSCLPGCRRARAGTDSLAGLRSGTSGALRPVYQGRPGRICVRVFYGTGERRRLLDWRILVRTGGETWRTAPGLAFYNSRALLLLEREAAKRPSARSQALGLRTISLLAGF